MMDIDHGWMKIAIELARQAMDANEVPVGAVIVDANNKCIGQGYNQVISTTDPSAHAEIVALRQAAKAIDNYRLIDTTLYVTLEPCLMCLGAIVHARVTRIVYATKDPKTGVIGSCMSACDLPFINHVPSCTYGPCEDESSTLLKEFFRARR